MKQALFAAMLTCATATAQPGAIAARERTAVGDPRSVSTQSLSLAQSGKWEDAIATASTGLQRCPAGDDGRPCRALLNYTMGFIYQLEADSSKDPQPRARSLSAGRDHYQSSLQDDPSTGAVHYNLALMLDALGQTQEAAAQLQQAIRSDPARASQYGVMLGDLYVRWRNPGAAFSAYQQAAAAGPAETPRWRILDLSAQGQGFSPSELEKQCGDWEPSLITLAASCYEHVMGASYADNPQLAESALLAWTDLLSREERISADSLKALPAKWQSPALLPLKNYLQGTPSGVDASWWQARERRQTWARFLLAAGHQLASQEPELVERYWKTALDTVHDPTIGVTADLERELALFYIRYKRPADLEQLIRRIFNDKSAVIANQDHRAEQRFHEVLGLIFMQQKRWGTYEGDPEGARYQLRRAVEVANQRFHEEGAYEPLPEIKQLRVQCYRALNDQQSANQALWDATLAWLDTDQLDRANESLAGLQPGPGLDKAALARIIDLRRRASSGAAGNDPGIVARIRELRAPAGLDPDFLHRQQFKALADIAAKSPAGVISVRSSAAMAAFDLVGGQHLPLVGAADLMRLQAVEYGIVQNVGGRTQELQIRRAVPGGGATLKLSLQGSSVPQEVQISPQTFEAAQINRILGPEKLARFGSTLYYEPGKVQVSKQAVTQEEIQKLQSSGLKVAVVPK
jgi:tetratricopeptide (TPR) repeat protein